MTPESEAGTHTARQEELPFAIVQGVAFTEPPRDLYIPPDALEVFLEAFEGPLDLLLYLIKRQNLDILDIPIAEITRQYMEYVELMKELRLALAAEYLVMAAMLAEIKSRMLLPRREDPENPEEDPRAELVRRLQEYERYKLAAETLEGCEVLGRDVLPVQAPVPETERSKPRPEPNVQELVAAMVSVMRLAQLQAHHRVRLEALSVRERMTEILACLRPDTYTEIARLFRPDQGRLGIVVTVLAVLELLHESLVQVEQSEPFTRVYVKALGR